MSDAHLPVNVHRALSALHGGSLTNNELARRFANAIAFVRSTDRGADTFGLPDIWAELNTTDRMAWGISNWERLTRNKGHRARERALEFLRAVQTDQ